MTPVVGRPGASPSSDPAVPANGVPTPDTPATPANPATGTLAPLAELGPGTLGRRLVVRMALLAALLSVLPGTAATLATRHQLTATVDRQLAGALARGERMGDEHGGLRRPLPGTQVGQVTVMVTPGGDGRSASAVLWVEGGDTSLRREVVQQLVDGAGARPTTTRLDGLGSYRAASHTAPDGTRRIVALPLAEVEHTVRQLVWFELALLAGAIAAAALAARAVVVRSLRPLNRLAATATEVSNLALDRGEVTLPHRVPPADADPADEVGRVGLALNHLLDNVEGALASRQESETRVRRFVADASHELRNPLASIRGYAELTRRGRDELPADARHAMERIEAESTRMSRLVEDMLLLARLDDDPTLELADTDVVEVVLHAVGDAQVAGPGHDWGVELPDQPVLARADALKLHQVLANLLANARRHTPPGTRVTTRVSSEGDQAVVSVVDDGPGVDESVRATAFERFARADPSRAHDAEGSTGLGLAIVAAVVQAHGGSVGLDSRPGHTCFTVRLPLAGAGAADVADARGDSTPEDSAPSIGTAPTGTAPTDIESPPPSPHGHPAG